MNQSLLMKICVSLETYWKNINREREREREREGFLIEKYEVSD